MNIRLFLLQTFNDVRSRSIALWRRLLTIKDLGDFLFVTEEHIGEIETPEPGDVILDMEKGKVGIHQGWSCAGDVIYQHSSWECSFNAGENILFLARPLRKVIKDFPKLRNYDNLVYAETGSEIAAILLDGESSKFGRWSMQDGKLDLLE